MAVVWNRLKALEAKAASLLFRGRETVRARLLDPGRRILFTNREDWREALCRAFRFSPHRIAFGDPDARALEEYDLFVPLTVRDIEALSRLPGITARNPLPLPNLDLVRLCDDKLRLNEALQAKGFGDLIPRMDAGAAYPRILKKRKDEWGMHSHVLRDADEEKGLAHLRDDPDYFCQELIPGHVEYATHLLMRNGEVAWALGIRYVFESAMAIKGKDRSICVRVCRSPCLGTFREVLNAIGWEGLCCLNFKLRGGRPFLFEINPRFGGSLCPFAPALVGHLLAGPTGMGLGRIHSGKEYQSRRDKPCPSAD